MINEIQGILAKWSTDMALDGPLYLSQAPEGSQLPIYILTIVSDVNDNSTVLPATLSQVSKLTVQFSCFATTDTAVLSAQSLIRTTFDRQPITVAGYPAVIMKHVKTQIIKEDRVVWHAWSEYDIWN